MDKSKPEIKGQPIQRRKWSLFSHTLRRSDKDITRLTLNGNPKRLRWEEPSEVRKKLVFQNHDIQVILTLSAERF